MTRPLFWLLGRGRPNIKSKRNSKYDQSTLDETGRGIPQSTIYAIHGAKALASTLESVSDLIPLPFLSAFVRLGLKILEACEQVTVIEENALDLQARVYELILAVVDTVPVNKRVSIELQDKVRKLQSVLNRILIDVERIKEQKKWLVLLFRDMNKDRIDRCVGRLNAVLGQFNVVSQLHVEDLLDRIRLDYSAVAAQLDRIENAVNRANRPHNAPSAYPRQDMPPSHRILCGRDELVNEIASLLVNQETSRVCITGIGGMGKTSVALAVTETALIRETFQKEYIFWVPCIEGKSADLLRRILYAQLRITADSYDSLDPLIAELNSLKQPRLVLLDNFETPWLSGQDQDKVADILARLAALPHIALLVTMTSGFTPGIIKWEHRPLSALDPAAARDAFRSMYRDAAQGHELAVDEPQLDEFLASIGNIPLAITLTAATGGRLRTSPTELLKDWGKAGTGMIIGNERLSMDETIRLSMGCGVMNSNSEALTLLAILSLLPAGTTGNNLRWWAPTVASPSAAVDALRIAALVEQGEGIFVTCRIFVRPTIQSYMSHNGCISAQIREQLQRACCEFVLHHKSIPDDHKFKADLKALASEETNVQGILMEVDMFAPLSKAVDALIALGFYQSWTKPSTVVASRALELARVVHESDSTDRKAASRVAEAHRCLGKTLFALDRYQEACTHFEDARARYKTLPGGADFSLAGEASFDLLRTGMYMQTRDKGELDLLAEEAKTSLCHDKTNEYSVGRGLLGFGEFLWWRGRRDEGLEMLSTARAIFEGLESPASAAECLFLIARTHARRDEYSKALPIAREALSRAEQSGEIGLICRISSITARYLIVSESYEDAMSTITRLLTLCQTLGSPLHIAQALELLAFNCAAMMDLSGARLAYTGARMQFAKIRSTRMGSMGVARCMYNLMQIEGATVMDAQYFSKVTRPHPMY
ncbi:hypothetical protein R3P38DRAFT_1442264 [Favolaschia claudopus]|uniref:NB-ARC domain-containing protein n=1 Tax=Favolaschia claudopus TaxID=2862362 RepID=A0AAW0AP52_9AGAR